MGVEAMWVYHPLVSRRLARITELAGVELIAWTVDDLPRMNKLVAAGVDGICSNDPRLFAALERIEWSLDTPMGCIKSTTRWLRPCPGSPSAGRCGRLLPSPPTPAPRR